MITQDKVRMLFDYEPDSGMLTWRVSKGTAKKGSDAGSVSGHAAKKYMNVMIDRKTYAAHRIIWLYVFGVIPDGDIDHINGNSLDNRIVNLRDVDKQENCRNARLCKRNKTGICGVSIHKQTGKFRVRISHGGKLLSLGLFNNLDDAAKARKDADIKYGYHENHGKRSSHNV